MMRRFTVLLSSAGRRPYLVRWFAEAFADVGIEGRVVLADLDASAPARGLASEFRAAPPADSDEYPAWLVGVLAEDEVDLAISVNDFELSRWARMGNDPVLAPLLRLSPAVQAAAEDKLGMARLLADRGIRVPELVPLAGAPSLGVADLVLKGRYGSGSRGLRFIRSAELDAVLPTVLAEVTDRVGAPAELGGDPERFVVAQERVRGQEYGLDLVSDLQGTHTAVLARKKLGMRAGETDRAVTVDATAFEELALRISEAVPHRGPLDVDVIVDETGAPYVIDVNPRFGGGYPFSHVAGARVPTALVAWATGAETSPAWFGYATEAVAAKSVEIVRVS